MVNNFTNIGSRTKAPQQKSPNNKKYKLMFFVSYIFFSVSFFLPVWICKILSILYYDSRLFLHLYFNTFIFGTWRYHKQLKYLFKITLIKESKNKVVLSLKKIIVYIKKQSEQITHSLILRASKVEKVIIVYQ